MGTVTIYLDYNVVKDDLVLRKSLSGALQEIHKEGLARIVVLSPTGQETEEMKKEFDHELMQGSFATLKELPNITKDITYISSDLDDLIEWSKLRGKPILNVRRTSGDFDGVFNTISILCDTEAQIYDKLKKYIHIGITSPQEDKK